MTVRKANARWQGDLKSGKGHMAFGSGAWEGQYSFSSRFESGTGSNPEELIAAAHAGCFSMALSNILAEAGHTPDSVETEAKVHLEMGDDGPSIPRIELVTEAVVPGIGQDEFHQHAEAAKKGCPVSKVLAGAEISLSATLK
ncbi:OsmC family protein [Wenzhouxiangella sediminis]|uniref:OsmC family peroxiredoxin n=1 Tax=Wenzhouxiangella sediminis TaxID=1792836 RepID=A0A3E1K5B9_9GAMM|nr:OsmC family protein [Wenzhouxiangella sediminis]RFF29148.1 OsmC family peroxiredoxin [Wenzhouxiangella sediminis]